MSSDDSEVDEATLDRVRAFFHPSDSVSFRNVTERDVVGGRLLVGELNTDRSSQTIAYFASDVLKMPSFLLQPESRSLFLFSKALGLQDIDFESHPDFTGNYDLAASQPDHARLLFNDAVLTYFGRHPGLQVMSNDYQLIVFQPGERFEGMAVEQFIRQATEVFALFEEAAVVARERVAEAPPVDPRRVGAPQGDSAEVGKHLVTPQDVDSFLAQRAPRNVPANIRRQRLGSTSMFFALLGPLMVAGGLSMSVAAGFFAGGRWNEARIAPIFVGTVFTLVGGLSGFFAWRYRLRNRRLLRHGVLAAATIESVEATEDHVGYERQYRTRLQLDAGGRQWMAECNIDQRVARRARRYGETGEPVRALYDPSDPSQILWAESLITVRADHALPRSGDSGD